MLVTFFLLLFELSANPQKKYFIDIITMLVGDSSFIILFMWAYKSLIFDRWNSWQSNYDKRYSWQSNFDRKGNSWTRISTEKSVYDQILNEKNSC